MVKPPSRSHPTTKRQWADLIQRTSWRGRMVSGGGLPVVTHARRLWLVHDFAAHPCTSRGAHLFVAEARWTDSLKQQRCRPPEPGKKCILCHTSRCTLSSTQCKSCRTSVETESPPTNPMIEFPIMTMSGTFHHIPLVVTPSLLPETAPDTLPDSAKWGIDQGVVVELATKHPKANDINNSEAINLASCSDDELSIEGNDDVRHKFWEYYSKKKAMKQKLLHQAHAQGMIELDNSNSSQGSKKRVRKYCHLQWRIFSVVLVSCTRACFPSLMRMPFQATVNLDGSEASNWLWKEANEKARQVQVGRKKLIYKWHKKQTWNQQIDKSSKRRMINNSIITVISLI